MKMLFLLGLSQSKNIQNCNLQKKLLGKDNLKYKVKLQVVRYNNLQNSLTYSYITYSNIYLWGQKSLFSIVWDFDKYLKVQRAWKVFVGGIWKLSQYKSVAKCIINFTISGHHQHMEGNLGARLFWNGNSPNVNCQLGCSPNRRGPRSADRTKPDFDVIFLVLFQS